jgi:Zn-finger nucleic acid-binding protein
MKCPKCDYEIAIEPKEQFEETRCPLCSADLFLYNGKLEENEKFEAFKVGE